MKCSPIGYVEREDVKLDDIWKESEALMRSDARVKVLHEYCPALEGIRKGALVWVIWYAHLTNERPLRVRPMKRPEAPLLGVFATRSPARPCPLGLSLVYVKEVEGCTLVVRGLDAFDGTPVLDLKLYYEGLDSPAEVLSRAL